MLKERLNILLKSRTDNFFVQFVRYTFVGGAAFAIDFGMLFLLTEYLGVYYLVSAAISFLLGLMVNYLLSVKWVFYKHTFTNPALEFLLFAVIGVIGLFINEFFLWVFTQKFMLYYLLSKIITAIIVYLWNFLARKALLFSKESIQK